MSLPPIPLDRNISPMLAHRRLQVLAGSHAWCLRNMRANLPEGTVLWVGKPTSQGCETLVAERMKTQLGREVDHLVYDAWDGFDPDAFGIAAGLVRGGGTLFLLAPPLDRWPWLDDPVAARVGVYPYERAPAPSAYLRRLAGLLEAESSVSICAEPEQFIRQPPVFPVSSDAVNREGGCITEDQAEAVKAILHAWSGHPRRPLVMLADRGRGKSAALGIAAKILLGEGCQIVVTAPRKVAAEVVFRHAGVELDAGTESIRFIAPDELLRSRPRADMLMVDEAAAIPLPMLKDLLRHYPRIVFSSTVHGYEGSGRGFFLRLRRLLEETTPGWREMRLRHPVRWAENDPLEAFCFRALMLDAETNGIDVIGDVDLQGCELVWLGKEQLLRDEALLRQVFGLLVSAHYETRPMDLRHLLDGPNLSLSALQWRGHILGVAMLATEGGLDEHIAGQIAMGRRRPRGHLIPQVIAVHLGIEEALRETGLRIVRIAILPELQGRGLGSRLLHLLARDAEAQGLQWLGASFGASAGLPYFWHKSSFLPLRLGSRQTAASGGYSLLMMCPLARASRCWIEPAAQRFTFSFAHALSDIYRCGDIESMAAILACCLSVEASSDEDISRVRRFADGLCEYEDVPDSLWRFALWALTRWHGGFTPADETLFIARILQKQPWSECAEIAGLPGRAGVRDRLRDILQIVLDSSGNGSTD